MENQKLPAHIRLEHKRLAVEVKAGELAGLCYDGREYMHPAEAPGWGHSDTEMFPIIGPTAQSAYRVQVPRGNAMLDQHGLFRELPYELVSSSGSEVVLEKSYKAGTPVPNSKFPDRSQLRMQVWPYPFQIVKTFSLLPDGVRISFELRGERDTPYMFGYHPAFRITSQAAKVHCGQREIGLEEVLSVGDRAFELPDCESLVLQDAGRLQLESRGFGHFMLWSPDPGMLCMEPITFYPYHAGPGRLHEGFRFLGDSAVTFSLSIRIGP